MLVGKKSNFHTNLAECVLTIGVYAQPIESEDLRLFCFVVVC